MFDGLAVHQKTASELERFVSAPAQSILLIGPSGVGKKTLAMRLVARLLDVDPEKLAHHPYCMVIRMEGKSIPIESIRKAQEFVRLKTTGNAPIRRIIVVQDAHLLTHEAQNAFLKLLEEPPSDTVILLTASTRESLLPTILSRTQNITVSTPARDEVIGHFVSLGFDAHEVTRAYHMSKGRPALMNAILTEDEHNYLAQNISAAKELLSLPVFDRLTRVEKLSKDKEQLPGLLWALQRVSDSALALATQKGDEKAIKHWHTSLKVILEAQDSLKSNPSPKLLLTNLMLQI